MAFAVVGIQAHFSKTLLLFFIPQIFNFILSCPQLFNLVPCPRHRLPRCVLGSPGGENGDLLSNILCISHRFDGQTNLLHPSIMTFEDKPPSRLATLVLRVLAAIGLTELKTRPQDGMVLEASNLTILNVFLVRLGPMTEKRLVQTLITAQVSGAKIYCSYIHI